MGSIPTPLARVFFALVWAHFQSVSTHVRVGSYENKAAVRLPLLGGSGGMLPPKILKSKSLEIRFLAFWGSKLLLAKVMAKYFMNKRSSIFNFSRLS